MNAQTLGGRVKALMKKRRMTQVELARKAGVTQAMVSSLVNDKHEESKKLQSIATALGVTVEYLATGTDDSRRQHGLGGSDAFRKWVPLMTSDEIKAFEQGRPFQNPLANEWYAMMKACSESTFAMKVSGSSMTSNSGLSFPDGTVIFVDPGKKPESGSFVVARSSAGVSFKRLEVDGGASYLVPLNPQFPTVALPDDATIIGTVVGAYTDV